MVGISSPLERGITVADQNEAQVAVLEGHGTCIMCLIIHALLLLLLCCCSILLIIMAPVTVDSRTRPSLHLHLHMATQRQSLLASALPGVTPGSVTRYPSSLIRIHHYSALCDGCMICWLRQFCSMPSKRSSLPTDKPGLISQPSCLPANLQLQLRLHYSCFAPCNTPAQMR